MRRVHEQEGGSIRAPGVPSAGDRQATKSGSVLVLRSAPWSARVKWKDRNADVLCRRRVVRRQGGGRRLCVVPAGNRRGCNRRPMVRIPAFFFAMPALGRCYRHVAALVVLAETVVCFQAPWLRLPCPASSGSGLRAPASSRRAALLTAPMMQGIGFDDGSGTVSRGDEEGKNGKGQEAGSRGKPGMPPGMEKLLSVPEILEAMKNPKLINVSLSARTRGERREKTRGCEGEGERARASEKQSRVPLTCVCL